MSIRLSPNHGINPTMGICFFCGEETGTIALTGKLPNDEEAPRKTVLNYEPCDKCRAQFEKGIAFFGVTKTALDNRPEIALNAYPTGSVIVLTEDNVRNAQFIKDEIKDEIIETGHALIPEELLQALCSDDDK